MRKAKAPGQRHQERKTIVRREHLIRCHEIFRQFTEGMIPTPPPLIGHLRGGIDAERMKRIREEIENREATRIRNGNGGDLDDLQA